MSDQRLINTDTLKGAFEMDGYKSPYVERFIDACPTVDAVPVVRCRDCMYWQQGENHKQYYWPCLYLHKPTKPNDYCSHGEKREVEDDDRI